MPANQAKDVSLLNTDAIFRVLETETNWAKTERVDARYLPSLNIWVVVMKNARLAAALEGDEIVRVANALAYSSSTNPFAKAGIDGALPFSSTLDIAGVILAKICEIYGQGGVCMDAYYLEVQGEENLLIREEDGYEFYGYDPYDRFTAPFPIAASLPLDTTAVEIVKAILPHIGFCKRCLSGLDTLMCVCDEG